MRKITLLITVLISFTLSEQFSNTIGIKAGVNYSQFTPDFEVAGITALEYQGKIGYYVGTFVNIGFSDTFSLQPELLFASQGTRTFVEDLSIRGGFAEPEQFVDIKTSVNEYSILLPVIFRYSLTEILFVEAGPQVGYAFSRTEIIKVNEFDPSTEGEKSTNSPLTTNFDKFDAGATIGIGYNLTEKLELNLRYALGIIERDDNYKTSVINFGVGFKVL